MKEQRGRSSSLSIFKKGASNDYLIKSNNIPIPPIIGKKDKKEKKEELKEGEKKEKFSFKKLLTPRSVHSQSPLTRNDNIIIENKFLNRTKSASSKKKIIEGLAEISAPTGFTRSFYLSMDLKWEFNDRNDLEFVQKMGQGEFGTVFKAVHKTSKFVVAVKVIKRENGEANKEAIEKEMEILKECQHENLVQYYGCNFAENELWV